MKQGDFDYVNQNVKVKDELSNAAREAEDLYYLMKARRSQTAHDLQLMLVLRNAITYIVQLETQNENLKQNYKVVYDKLTVAEAVLERMNEE